MSFDWCCRCRGCLCKCICELCSGYDPYTGAENAPCCWHLSVTFPVGDYSGYSGNYYLNQDDENGCTWSRNYPPECGPEVSLELTDNGDDTYTFTVTLDPPALDAVVWSKTFEGKPDCCQRDSIELDLVTGPEKTYCAITCTEYSSCPLLPCRWCNEATLPRFIQVTIPGPMYNSCGSCTGCTSFPGIYILELVEGCPTDGCKWAADISSVVDCGLYKHTIEFWYSTDDGYWYMEILMDWSNPMHAGLDFAITGWDCSTIDSSGKMGAFIFPQPGACSSVDWGCQGYYVAFEAIPNA